MSKGVRIAGDGEKVAETIVEQQRVPVLHYQSLGSG